ncbi:MAG TPA: methylamine utilization protein MauJ [Candidatus Acidoferrum sp.]|nr:methylamine utilization protein MauJ [Candidatus Acidoferrum sp.]
MSDHDPRTSPFLRFVSGTRVDLPNSLYENAQEVLTRLGEGQSISEVFDSLIRKGLVGGQYTVLPESTWYALLKNYLTYYAGEFSDFENLEAHLIELLKLMTARPHGDAWRRIEEFLLGTIDNLSGWRKSWHRQDAEQRGVFKGEDGNYYYHDRDGILIQIIGAKTLPETHLDFVTDAVMRGYGPIRKILNVFALFAISEDFAANSASYPGCLRLLIAEPESGMLTPRWHRMQFHQVRTVRWRPLDILCDPEWLAEQVLARLTDNLDRDPWSERIEKYKQRENRLDAECPFQLDHTLDSGLVIGDEEEIYFPFEGRTFRWINGTPESQALLSVGCKDLEDPSAVEAVNRLLSCLVWSHHAPIRKGFGIGGLKRTLPLTWGPRMSGGIKVNPAYLLTGYKPGSSARRNLALALYKEGKNADSVFYAYLSYWKILEVAIPDKKDRWDWINNNAARTYDSQRAAEIVAVNPNVAEYLDYSGRCAIAHVFHQPVIDPDNREDNVRISKDVRLVESLARIAVEDGLAD